MTNLFSTQCLYFNPVSLAPFFYSPSHFINTALASSTSFPLLILLHRWFLQISFLTLIRRQTQSSAARGRCGATTTSPLQRLLDVVGELRLESDLRKREK